MYPGFSSPGFYDPYGQYATTNAASGYGQHSEQFCRNTPPQQLIPFGSSVGPLPRQDIYVGVDAVVVYIGSIELNHQIKRVPMVARVTVVDYQGNVLLDTYVRPTHYIEDYRAGVTGLQPSDLINAPYFQDVQIQVAGIIRNKILVGHSLWNFLSVLGLSHPALYTRDLALFRPLRKRLKSKLIVSLPTLTYIYMKRNVGLGHENSLELARASMDLFRYCEHIFERVVQDGAWPCNLPPSAFAEYFT